MKSYKELITELFEQPYNWEIRQNQEDFYLAYFDTDENKYIVGISNSPRDPDSKSLTFSAKGKDDENSSVFKVTQENKASKVLTTIAEITKYYVEKYQPEEIEFTAEKAGIGRASVYKKLLNRMLTNNYTVEESELGSLAIFRIKKK